MKKNQLFATIVVVLIVLPLLAGCQAVGQKNIAVAAPVENRMDVQAVENAMVNRWITMARFYEKRILAARSLTELSAAEVTEYRWDALARYYSEHPFVGKQLTELNSSDVVAYRWLAEGKFYAWNPYAGVDLTSFNADQALVYRWLVIARAYEK